MRTINKLLNLKSSFDMTDEERVEFQSWLNVTARYSYTPYDFSILLGWYTLDNYTPISIKEAGLL